MILTHKEITALVEKEAISRPSAKPALGVTSATLHLGNQFAFYQPATGEPFVPPMEMPLSRVTLTQPGAGYVLKPNDAVLVSSEETVNMPLNLIGLIQTKSSLARGFLMAHPSSGQIEPGYRGTITFELVNFSKFNYKLIPGMPVAELYFLQLASELKPGQGYNGRYQGSVGPQGMK